MSSTFKLADGEHTVLATRKHWFIIAAEEFGYAILLVLPFAVYPFVSDAQFTAGAQAVTLSFEPALMVFLGSAWTLFVWMRIVGTWTDYYLDIWIVTNKRIIDIEQKGLFHRQTSVFRIERIQDVTVETKGIIATLLNFGDIHVQTAGEGQEFIMRGIANPRRIREAILKQHDYTADRARQVRKDTPAHELARMPSEHGHKQR